MSPITINNERQNKPTQVVRDLAPYVEADRVYDALLRRGFFKWAAGRRDLIRLKNRIKEKITESLVRQEDGAWRTRRRRKGWERGYRAALEEMQAEIRAICHSPRWRAPDNDREAQRWLEEKGYENQDSFPAN